MKTLRITLIAAATLALAACGGNDRPEGEAVADAAQADAANAATGEVGAARPELIASTQSLTGGSSFSVDDLPSYEPETTVSGRIRSYGFGFGGILVKWQEDFKRFHPGVEFDNTLPTSDAAFPALVTYSTDLAPNGSEPAITETLGFFETRGYHVSDIVVASGAFDVKGRSNGPVVFVHKDNPITRLSIDQLDGIFGSERNGGMRGFEWTPSDARGADRNVRTWGDLGLTGEWADKPIQTYGHAPSGTTRFFQRHVLANTDKWNPNYRGYAETGSKMIAAEDKQEQKLGVKYMLENEMSKDRYGIVWTIMSQAEGVENLKLVAIAPRGTTDYVQPSQQSFRDRSYPLTRSIYLYFDRKPGDALDPKLREFMRYALSREGQQMVADGDYLPLTAKHAAEQRAKLD